VNTVIPTTHESHCENSSLDIIPGDKVMVFDATIFKNDVDTPLSQTIKKATVVRRYGNLQTRYCSGSELGPYADLVDVVFDHRPESVSHGHFTDRIVRAK